MSKRTVVEKRHVHRSVDSKSTSNSERLLRVLKIGLAERASRLSTPPPSLQTHLMRSGTTWGKVTNTDDSKTITDIHKERRRTIESILLWHDFTMHDPSISVFENRQSENNAGISIPVLTSFFLTPKGQQNLTILHETVRTGSGAIINVSPGGKGTKTNSDLDVSIALQKRGDEQHKKLVEGYATYVIEKVKQALVDTPLKAKFDCNFYFVVSKQGEWFWDGQYATDSNAKNEFLAAICQKYLFHSATSSLEAMKKTTYLRRYLNLTSDPPDIGVIHDFYREASDAESKQTWSQSTIHAEQVMFERYSYYAMKMLTSDTHMANDLANFLQYQPESYVFPGCTSAMVPIYNYAKETWLSTGLAWLAVLENAVDALVIPEQPKKKYVQRLSHVLCDQKGLMDDRMCALIEDDGRFATAFESSKASLLQAIEIDASEDGICSNEQCQAMYQSMMSEGGNPLAQVRNLVMLSLERITNDKTLSSNIYNDVFGIEM